MIGVIALIIRKNSERNFFSFKELQFTTGSMKGQRIEYNTERHRKEYWRNVI